MPDDVQVTMAELEQQAEEQAPGVLDILEAYSEIASRPVPWQPINAGLGTLDTGTGEPVIPTGAEDPS